MKTVMGFLLLIISCSAAQAQPFIEEVKAFKAQDSLQPPPAHPILFIGSSSFRKWTDVQADFPGYTILNRGFGGSTLPDVIRYANDLIFPYHPKEIVIYCGENDLAVSDEITGDTVAARFVKLFGIIRGRMPAVPIVFVSLKPSPSRERLFPQMQRANTLIRQYLTHQKKAWFVDVYHLMLNSKGKPLPDIFLEDQLHMNRKGYALWVPAIRPYLLK